MDGLHPGGSERSEECIHQRPTVAAALHAWQEIDVQVCWVRRGEPFGGRWGVVEQPNTIGVGGSGGKGILGIPQAQRRQPFSLQPPFVLHRIRRTDDVAAYRFLVGDDECMLRPALQIRSHPDLAEQPGVAVEGGGVGSVVSGAETYLVAGVDIAGGELPDPGFTHRRSARW